MTEKIEILPGEVEAQLAKALEWVYAGLVIAAPLENGYVYLADAFTHDAVRSIHALRGDDLGIAAQVLIPSVTVLDGIARDISPQTRLLMDHFWPGPLSFMVRPQTGLSWDLGDGKRLDQICVRVPNVDFILALLRRSGPLVVASAATAGSAPILDAKRIPITNPVLAGIFDGGVLSSSLGTTIVSDTETGPTLVRNGVITLEELRELLPEIEYEDSAN